MSHGIVLCRYDYDPLDRLATRTPLADAVTRSFYSADRLANEIQGDEQRSFLYRESQLLALQTLTGQLLSKTLAATDQPGSVLGTTTSGQRTAIAYTPYGYHDPIKNLPGFNGERPDPVTGHYLLGKGYRAYNPVLMRFNNPDSLSPFGEGGVNPYAYCLGDPVNHYDPTGHVSWQFIVGIVLSVAALTAAAATLLPSLPFLLSVKAAQAGFFSAGSLSTMITGTSAVAGGVLGVTRQIVAEVAPDSPLLEPMGWAALAIGVVAASTRVGTVIAARNPKNLANLQSAVAPKLLSSAPIELDEMPRALSPAAVIRS
ncbi:RHS repeat-associated core domain-containing protein [Pseudomonas sp. KFB-139]|uniref:RHS repeat-associated core domain-containing protein n=1 Tax=Pseudomonas serbiensis TaxID=3064350 RepID=A0ABT9CNI5_9PSED|nr:RHS repeat-associated core domain-containing protein [Pseudomonas sp. KFB-138]MDO7927058.1 RHS repeat-associated core domain-containing protein [Pseudomonas sp. KFB-138]